MGLKDGTRNIRAEDSAELAEFVWVGDEGPAWLGGGTYMVARRIRMVIESWDRTNLAEQERTIGRAKYSGAPLTGTDEFDPPDFEARGPEGPVFDRDAHVRLSSGDLLGTRILRRGYSFTDGFDEVTGQLDAGLFFICFQRDPDQFERIQRNLSGDILNEYIFHTSSAVFAIPPGRDGGHPRRRGAVRLMASPFDHVLRLPGAQPEDLALAIASEFVPVDPAAAHERLDELALSMPPIARLPAAERALALVQGLACRQGVVCAPRSGPDALLLDRGAHASARPSVGARDHLRGRHPEAGVRAATVGIDRLAILADPSSTPTVVFDPSGAVAPAAVGEPLALSARRRRDDARGARDPLDFERGDLQT